MNVLLKLVPKSTPDQTAKLAMSVLVASGIDPKAISYDAEGFRLSYGEQQLYLGNLHDLLGRVWPWQRRRVARNFVASFLATPDRPKSLEDARAYFLPGFRDAWMFEAMALEARINGSETLRPVGYALGSRLWVGVFLDYPNSTSMVMANDLENWGASFEDCLKAATGNLLSRSRGSFTEIAPGIYHSPWQDRYDPARIHCPEVLGSLHLPGDPVAIVPNWNHLLLTGADDPEALATCIGIASKIASEEPRRLSCLPVVRRGTQWVDLVLPRGHSAEPALRKTRILELNSLYGDQAALINRVHEKEGTDIYVGKYTALRRRENEGYDSYAVWSKEVVTLLPHAETVKFFDGERPEGQQIAATIDWDTVERHCKNLMKDAGYVLPRYLVDGFPTDEQLEAMKAAQALRAD